MRDPVGENGWLDLVDEGSRTAGNIEQRIAVMELYKRATIAEPWSKKLWLANCEWVWSLYTDCQNGDAGWPEEEQLLGQEVFALETALDAWQEGYEAIKYRINDSHELWNRWISIETEILSPATPDQNRIDRVRGLFLDRIQIPHSTFDQTFQMYSEFVTKFYRAADYESMMASGKKWARAARELYDVRETHEDELIKAASSGEDHALRSTMKNYLDWEVSQTLKRPRKGVSSSPLILCVALFERALSSASLSFDPLTWEDYIVFISTASKDTPDELLSVQLPAVLPVIQRATDHCPWSGRLWARCLLRAESEHQPFEFMEQIKQSATNTRELDRDGMDGVLEFYIAWSGYLKRMTMTVGATDEHIDVAEMGLLTALKDVQQWGKRRYGEKEWKGDPSFRVERIFIQYLTQKGSFEEARKNWKGLVRTHSNSYEFWQQYYVWEMTVRISTAPPVLATSVLVQAIGVRTLDWPEKMMEIYVRHCEDYEEVDTLLKALGTVHSTSKIVASRRQQEAVEAAAMYAQPGAEPNIDPESATLHDTSMSPTKRKRDPGSGSSDEASPKKIQRMVDDSLQQSNYEPQKRNRECTTVLVSNLPRDTTQTKMRQYFREFGHVYSITSKPSSDGETKSFMVEFEAPVEAQSALLRDGKEYGGRVMEVKPGIGLNLFVTNFPPTADDQYIQDLFKECGEVFNIRWPSLKHNTHRRFCYVSFQTPEAAAAAAALDGLEISHEYHLVAVYSNPSNKKIRESVITEGRELHVKGLDWEMKEKDVEELFSKYGTIQRIRLLKTRTGESKGSCFVVFETKEQATAALELDKTMLKSRVLVVEMSTIQKFKPTAAVLGKASSASPGPDGDSAMLTSPAPDSQHTPSRTEITNRTITLLNIPDTVNAARVRALAEAHGEITKLSLRPDHQGAIVEYADAASAGRAALFLQNHEIVPGRTLSIGDMKDLFAQKEEIRSDQIQIGPGKKITGTFMQPGTLVRRPGTAGRGGKGGLGSKRGLGYTVGALAPRAATASSSADSSEKKPKSNADFKAMFVKEGKD